MGWLVLSAEALRERMNNPRVKVTKFTTPSRTVFRCTVRGCLGAPAPCAYGSGHKLPDHVVWQAWHGMPVWSAKLGTAEAGRVSTSAPRHKLAGRIRRNAVVA